MPMYALLGSFCQFKNMIKYYSSNHIKKIFNIKSIKFIYISFEKIYYEKKENI